MFFILVSFFVTVHSKSSYKQFIEFIENKKKNKNIFETKSNYYNTRNVPAFSSRNIKNLEPNTYRDETSYYSKWIQGQNQNLEVPADSAEFTLPDRVH